MPSTPNPAPVTRARGTPLSWLQRRDHCAPAEVSRTSTPAAVEAVADLVGQVEAPLVTRRARRFSSAFASGPTILRGSARPASAAFRAAPPSRPPPPFVRRRAPRSAPRPTRPRPARRVRHPIRHPDQRACHPIRDGSRVRVHAQSTLPSCLEADSRGASQHVTWTRTSNPGAQQLVCSTGGPRKIPSGGVRLGDA